MRAGSFGQRGSTLYPFVGYKQACTSMEPRHAVELGKRRAGRRAPVFNRLGVRIRGIGGGPLAPASPQAPEGSIETSRWMVQKVASPPIAYGTNRQL